MIQPSEVAWPPKRLKLEKVPNGIDASTLVLASNNSIELDN